MMKRAWLLGCAAALMLVGGVVLAQSSFPLVSAVTGGMILKNEASPTYAYMTVDQIGTYLATGGGSNITTVPHGGTGVATMTAHGLVVGEGTSPIAVTAAGTTGQLLQGVSSADPAWATTLSGAYTFTATLLQLGGAAGTPVHVSSGQTTAPALTSCGTGSPSIVGSDSAGTVTMGTGATGCVVTFNVAYTAAPTCVVNWVATPLASQSWTVSTTALTLTQTSTAGNKAAYICVGVGGG